MIYKSQIWNCSRKGFCMYTSKCSCGALDTALRCRPPTYGIKSVYGMHHSPLKKVWLGHLITLQNSFSVISFRWDQSRFDYIYYNYCYYLQGM